MKPYIHHVQYYETDKMGITHHSNYIRFMEEARLDFFKQIGFDYLEFEKLGIISPVVGLNNIKFKKPTTVGDEIEIEIHIKAYTGVTLTVHYTMKKGDLLVLEGDSEHCFLSKEGRILVINEKNFPDFHAKMRSLLEEGAK
ncbi:MAG: acyl-CoA thioesterase [Bacilli bacterium]|nr:acyl-CoA thioesterase [Bacilli bacterium]